VPKTQDSPIRLLIVARDDGRHAVACELLKKSCMVTCAGSFREAVKLLDPEKKYWPPSRRRKKRLDPNGSQSDFEVVLVDRFVHLTSKKWTGLVGDGEFPGLGLIGLCQALGLPVALWHSGQPRTERLLTDVQELVLIYRQADWKRVLRAVKRDFKTLLHFHRPDRPRPKTSR